MKYFFILGNTPELAREEVRAVLPHQELFYDPPVLILETEEEISFEKFGGVIKVGEIIDEKIVDFLKNSGEKKIDFGISNYSKDSGHGQNDEKEIKRELEEAGIRARFVLPRGGMGLSSVVVKKQKLVEFLKYKSLIAKTIWVQDFEDWGKRDYARPEVEAHIGMLPPKVARQMVNIAQAKSILDPFCGVGTILSEALILGIKVIGSDINQNQIKKTQNNLDWLSRTYHLEPSNFRLFVCDARKIFEKVTNIDAIVTETDLGPKAGLDQLYLDCFIAWKGKVKTVVIALPNLKVIDKIKAMGYILTAGPFIYARPQAKIKRHICVFQYGTY